MPPRKLPFLAGYDYHLYNRGVNHADIFFCESHYLYLLELMKKRLRQYPIRVVAYCLMPNHYHFLVQPDLDHCLNWFMKSLFSAYTQGVNQQQGRDGSLFRGRFRALMVDKEEYLAHIARYIHLNPVYAGMVRKPEDWRFSNYLDIIGKRSGELRDDSLVPRRFQSGEDYQRFVEERLDTGIRFEEINNYDLE